MTVPIRWTRPGWRRSWPATAAAILALGACSTPAETSADNAPRHTITDASGRQIQIPVAPRRVVALSEQDLDAALALGAPVVGTVNGRGQRTPPRYLGTRTKGIAVVGEITTPSLDKIYDVEPDLILAGGVSDQNLLNSLAKAAPTVVTYRLATDWKTAFALQSNVLAKTEAAASVRAAYSTKLATVRTALGRNANATVSIVRWNPTGPTVMQTGQFASLVLSDAGLRRPATQQEPGFSHSAPLSLESLSKIDADWIFFGTLTPTGKATEALHAAQATPAFQQLNAVRAGRVVPVDGSLWTSRGGPLAAVEVLNNVTAALTRAT